MQISVKRYEMCSIINTHIGKQKLLSCRKQKELTFLPASGYVCSKMACVGRETRVCLHNFRWATSTWLQWEPQPVTFRQLPVFSIITNATWFHALDRNHVKTVYVNQGMAPGTTIIDLSTSVTDGDVPPPDNYEYSINPYQIVGVSV